MVNKAGQLRDKGIRVMAICPGGNPTNLNAFMEFHLLFADCGWSAIAVGHWIPVMLSASMEFHLLFGDCGWSAITVGHRITVMLSASMSFHLLLSMAPLRSTLIVFGEQFCGEATYPSIINRYCQMRYYSARFVCALYIPDIAVRT